MNKDVTSVVLFLGVVFLMTFAAHLLFVKGYAFNKSKAHADGHKAVSIFSSKEECEEQTHANCILQLCDEPPENDGHEDICGQGYKEGWQPEKAHSEDAH